MRNVPRPIAAVVGLAFLTTACGGGGSPANEQGAGENTPAASAPATPAEGESGAPARGDADLVVWTDELKVKAVKSIADRFAETNGITTDVQVISGELQTNFVTANTAGNGPDVVVGAHDWIGNMVQNGAIDPLQLTPDQLTAYSDVAVNATTYNGQLYGLPYGVETLGLYRNTAVVPDAPKTLDEAFAAGKKAVADGKVKSPFNLPVGENGDAYHMQPLFTSGGGYLFGKTPDGDYDAKDLGLATEAGIAAAKRIHALGEEGEKVLRRSVSADNSIALFASGQAAFLVSGPWALGDLNAGKVKFDVQPLPGFEGQKAARPFAGAQAFFVASKGRNKAFAQEFVANAVNTEESMQAMFEGANLPPSMTSVRKVVAKENPMIATFAAAAEKSADPMPAIPAMAAVWEPLGKAYAAIVGGADPESTMRKTNKTIEQAIASS